MEQRHADAEGHYGCDRGSARETDLCVRRGDGLEPHRRLDTLVYNPASNTWSKGVPLPEPIFNPSAAVVQDVRDASGGVVGIRDSQYGLGLQPADEDVVGKVADTYADAVLGGRW